MGMLWEMVEGITSATASRRTHLLRDAPSSASATGLPPEVVARARQHFTMAVVLCAATFILLFATMNYAPLPTAGDLRIANYFAVGNIILSLLVLAIARSDWVSSERLLDIALVYQVLQGLGICLAETYATYDPFGTVRGVSWVCVWIIAFPLVVPSTPGKTLLTALATATMGPVALLIAIASGVPNVSLLTATYLVLPNYAAAAIAFVLSTRLYRLREDVSRAQRMGSYQLTERLGEGGMGEVWRAEHEMLARPAAIKLIRHDALVGRSDDDIDTIFRRFKREAEATAKLSSPHTVRVFDFGMTEDGTLYYVMELLDGVDLETLIAEHGPISPARAIDLLRQVCDSLAEAHEQGLIHRDIKPANIYVCRLGREYDQAKVLDFGLVSIKDNVERDATKLTAEGTLTGTPAFMAPEMVKGGSEADERVDVYALGCVAYWLLTGQLVFDGDTPLQVVFGHVEKEPTPPSLRVARAIPKDLEHVVMACLSKNPADRPRNATELSQMLERCNVAPWTQEQARQWWDAVQPDAA